MRGSTIHFSGSLDGAREVDAAPSTGRMDFPDVRIACWVDKPLLMGLGDPIRIPE